MLFIWQFNGNKKVSYKYMSKVIYTVDGSYINDMAGWLQIRGAWNIGRFNSDVKMWVVLYDKIGLEINGFYSVQLKSK